MSIIANAMCNVITPGLSPELTTIAPRIALVNTRARAAKDPKKTLFCFRKN